MYLSFNTWQNFVTILVENVWSTFLVRFVSLFITSSLVCCRRMQIFCHGSFSCRFCLMSVTKFVGNVCILSKLEFLVYFGFKICTSEWSLKLECWFSSLFSYLCIYSWVFETVSLFMCWFLWDFCKDLLVWMNMRLSPSSRTWCTKLLGNIFGVSFPKWAGCDGDLP